MSETSSESSLEQAERVSLGSLSSRNPPTESDGRCTSIEQVRWTDLRCALLDASTWRAMLQVCDPMCAWPRQAEGVRLGNSPRWPTAGHSLLEGAGSPMGSRQGFLRDQAAEHGDGQQPYLAGQR